MRSSVNLFCLVALSMMLNGCWEASVSSSSPKPNSPNPKPANHVETPSDPEDEKENATVAPEPAEPEKPDFGAMEVSQLLEYAKQNDIAMDVNDEFELTFYPDDIDRGFTAAIIGRKDDVIRALKPDLWTSKKLIGRWEERRPGSVSTINIRADGVLELTRQDSNLIIRTLNAALNGTIYYQWSYNDGKLYIKNVASEKELLDKLRFLSDAESTRVEMGDADHFTLVDPNGLAQGDWTRIGL